MYARDFVFRVANMLTLIDTRILCEINSDLSAADEKKFQEKNRHFWSLQKHYLRIEYSVRVLIGPADIRFELWFDDQKLSRDESIRVEWIPAQVPQIAEMSGAGREAVEMSNTPPTPIGAAPSSGAFNGGANKPAMKTGGFAVVSKRPTGEMEDRKARRGMGGLFGKSSSFFGRAA
jgi:hypothetical protein